MILLPSLNLKIESHEHLGPDMIVQFEKIQSNLSNGGTMVGQIF
jgi:hypothetical protein